MPSISIGAYVAWQYAAGETVAAGHPQIEARHLFLGILSLEKAFASDGDLEMKWNELEALRQETDLVEQALSRLGFEPATLRRNFRKRLGRGSHVQSESVVHRSNKCRAIFAHAQTLAGQDKPMTALHLLAIVAEDVQDSMDYQLREVGILSGELAEAAHYFANTLGSGRAKVH